MEKTVLIAIIVLLVNSISAIESVHELNLQAYYGDCYHKQLIHIDEGMK